jgi:hypothetical protein
VWKKLLFLSLLSLGPAWGQSVLQSGPIGSGHAPMYTGAFGQSQAVIGDSGPAAGGGTGVGLGELGLTVRGTGTPPYANAGTGPYGANLCDYDAPITNSTGYHYICLSPNVEGGESIIAGFSGSTGGIPLQFIINGVVTPINSSGNLLPTNNVWTGTNTFSGAVTLTTAAPTVLSGQIGYGGTTVAASNCGSLASAVGCVVINVAGTVHYVPYY